jgi:uncharacterized membrane protein YdjX (TVP38/TMEM64 family)
MTHLRLAILAFVLIGLFTIGSYYDITERMDVEAIRGLVVDAGALGWFLYVAIFSGGEFVHIPGLVFVAAGILVYGKLLGFGLAFVASVVSVCFSFFVVRRIGGTPLERAQNPRLQNALAHLDERPIRTVLVMRLIFWLAPPLNYALALTGLRFRDYLIGSALGLLIPIAAAAYFFDWLITLL